VKTTIDIASNTLARSKEVARRDKVTLRELGPPQDPHPAGDLRRAGLVGAIPPGRLGKDPPRSLRRTRIMIAVETTLLIYAAQRRF